jgi:hypothetical protein
MEEGLGNLRPRWRRLESCIIAQSISQQRMEIMWALVELDHLQEVTLATAWAARAGRQRLIPPSQTSQEWVAGSLFCGYFYYAG